MPNERRPIRPVRAASKSPDRPEADSARSDGTRLEDHAAIDRLVDELLPALVAKLSATQLGEIQVREGDWRVRLRRPADGVVPRGRSQDRSPDRASRAQPGHEGHGHARTATEGHRTTRSAASPALSGSSGSLGSNGSGSLGPLPVGPGRPIEVQTRPASGESHRVVATSTAVGIYQPRAELTPGTRVRAGDRIGSVNMLGVPQEVVAPADGVVGASFAEAGDAVEYGQDLIAIELVTALVDSVDGADGRPGGSLGGGA